MEQSLYPFGKWIWLQAPNEKRLPYYTYFDTECGLSAQVTSEEADLEPGQGGSIIRLTVTGWQWEEVTQVERSQLNLPEVPEWLHVYGRQPTPGILWGGWRTHPLLVGKFLEDYPDDLQVSIHDGGPLRNKPILPELVWVRVCGITSHPFGYVFDGVLLNKPHHTKAASQYHYMHFMASPGAVKPILVTDEYVQERGNWRIQVCNSCGLTEMFDLPTDLYKSLFPKAASQPGIIAQKFTFYCPVCRTGRIAARRATEDDPYSFELSTSDAEKAKKRWWRFW